MFIRFYKSSYLPQYFLLIIIEFIFWLPSFINPPAMPEATTTTPIYQIFVNLFSGIPLLATLAGFIFLFFQGVLLNETITKFRIIPKNQLMAAFIYVFFMSIFKNLHTLHPVLLVNLIIILLLNCNFGLYERKADHKINVFICGFLISIASFTFNHSVYLIILLYLILILMRIYSWREWIIPIISFFIPVIFLCVYYVWIQELQIFITSFSKETIKLQFEDIHHNYLTGILLSFSTFLFLISSVFILYRVNTKNIDVRKRTYVIFYCLIISTLVYLFNKSPQNSLTLAIVPVASIISIRLAGQKYFFWNNLLLWIIFIFANYINYASLWFPKGIF